MTFTKDDYRDAKAASDAAWEAYNSTSEAVLWKEASRRLDEICDQLGDVSTCAACNSPIFDDDLRSYDRYNGEDFCADCSATWADFEAEPDSFYCGEDENGPIYFTRETAKLKIEAHLAAGGKMTDHFVHMFRLVDLNTEASK